MSDQIKRYEARLIEVAKAFVDHIGYTLTDDESTDSLQARRLYEDLRGAVHQIRRAKDEPIPGKALTTLGDHVLHNIRKRRT